MYNQARVESLLKGIFLIMAFVLSPVLVPSVNAQGGSTAATLTDDTYYGYGSGGPDPGHGSLPTLETGLLTMAFLKFNIPSIPDGATGITAVLELFTTVNGVKTPHSVAAYQLEDTTWTESSPPEGVYPWIFSDVLAVTDVADNEMWYEWNVTDAVVGALSDDSDAVTLILSYMETMGQTRTPSVFFASKESSTTTIPKLTLAWSSVIPTSTPTSTPTPTPTPTPTLEPTPTPSPESTSTPEPTTPPTPTHPSSPVATPTAAPSQTSTPWPSPTQSALPPSEEPQTALYIAVATGAAAVACGTVYLKKRK